MQSCFLFCGRGIGRLRLPQNSTCGGSRPVWVASRAGAPYQRGIIQIPVTPVYNLVCNTIQKRQFVLSVECAVSHLDQNPKLNDSRVVPSNCTACLLAMHVCMYGV